MLGNRGELRLLCFVLAQKQGRFGHAAHQFAPVACIHQLPERRTAGAGRVTARGIGHRVARLGAARRLASWRFLAQKTGCDAAHRVTDSADNLYPAARCGGGVGGRGRCGFGRFRIGLLCVGGRCCIFCRAGLLAWRVWRRCCRGCGSIGCKNRWGQVANRVAVRPVARNPCHFAPRRLTAEMRSPRYRRIRALQTLRAADWPGSTHWSEPVPQGPCKSPPHLQPSKNESSKPPGQFIQECRCKPWKVKAIRPCACLNRAKDTITCIAQARHDIPFFVQMAVQRGGYDPHIGVLLGHDCHAFGRGQQADKAYPRGTCPL